MWSSPRRSGHFGGSASPSIPVGNPPRRPVLERERTLHHPVADPRYRKDADFAPVFRYLLLPGSEWLVSTPDQFVPQLLEPSSYALCFDGLEGNSSTPGAPSFCLAIPYAARRVSILQTWAHRPQKRQDGSAFALDRTSADRPAVVPPQRQPCHPVRFQPAASIAQPMAHQGGD
jgi:hypothetical protein